MRKYFIGFKKITRLAYEAALDLDRHYGLEHAGYISFLVLLTIFPFFALLVAIVGNIAIKLGINAEVITAFFKDFFSNKEAWQFIDAFLPTIFDIISSPPNKFLTFAIFSMLWTASSIFFALRTIINIAYRINESRGYIVARAVIILEFILFILLLTLILFLFTLFPYVLSFVNAYFADQLNFGITSLINSENFSMYSDFFYIRYLISQFVLWLSILLLFYWIPSKKEEIKYAIPGAIVVLVGWNLFSYIFKCYIKYFPQINMVYGSIAGVVIALMYFYFCSVIFIYGAELNHKIKRYKSEIQYI